MSESDGFETHSCSPPKRKNKYGAKKVVIDGIAFDSGSEGRRYCELKLLLRGGLIADLELQPRFDIVVNGKKCGFYKADFRYRVLLDDHITIEDVKSSPTSKNPVYRLKKKLVEAIYDIEITEVKA